MGTHIIEINYDDPFIHTYKGRFEYDGTDIVKNYNCSCLKDEPNFIDFIADGRKSFNQDHFCFDDENATWGYCLNPNVHNMFIDSGFNYRIVSVKFYPFRYEIECDEEAIMMLKLST